MYVIRKQFTFSAAHLLKNLPQDHPCGRLHGHNYKVEVLLRSPTLTKTERWVRDYRNLDAFNDYLQHNFDHHNLNDVLENVQTTAETLAEMFFYKCKTSYPETFCVRVSETDKTWAEYWEA